MVPTAAALLYLMKQLLSRTFLYLVLFQTLSQSFVLLLNNTKLASD